MSSSELHTKYHNSLKTIGYNYHTFFPIAESDGKIELRFKVKAHRDAHILLSTNMYPDANEPAYEIALGAGNNTFCAIRRFQQSDNEADSHEATVSPDEWTEFWIKIKEGKIKVGKDDDGAFMKYRDPQPVPVSYFSFSCYEGASALWKFPCFSDHDFWL